MKRFLYIFAIISLCFLTACSSKGLSKRDNEAIYQEAYAAGYRDGFADGQAGVSVSEEESNSISILSAVTAGASANVSRSADSENMEATVYVTRTGKKYHRAGCHTIRGHEAVGMTKSDAEAMGKGPCLICNP